MRTKFCLLAITSAAVLLQKYEVSAVSLVNQQVDIDATLIGNQSHQQLLQTNVQKKHGQNHKNSSKEGKGDGKKCKTKEIEVIQANKILKAVKQDWLPFLTGNYTGDNPKGKKFEDIGQKLKDTIYAVDPHYMPIERIDSEQMEKFVKHYRQSIKSYEKSLIPPKAGSKKALKPQEEPTNKRGNLIHYGKQQDAFEWMMKQTQRLLQHVVGDETNNAIVAGYAKQQRKKLYPKRHIDDKDEPTPKPPNPLLDSLMAMAG